MIDAPRHLIPPRRAAGASPDVFERYRDSLDSALAGALAARRLPLYDMLRYHLGLEAPEGARGKALRPTLCLLTCEALGGDAERSLPAAASLELIHNFSLIHDDIQDGDRERRHRPTVWSRWGIPQAINAGDVMFCLATLTLQDLRSSVADGVVVDVIQTVQEAAREMIEGQYLDVSYETAPEVSLDDYLEMIRLKTGALIRASVEVGAMLADAGTVVRTRCRRFGEALGRLFQITDDLLGVWGRSESTGKPVDSDIRRKKKSLPIVLALAAANESQRSELLRIYEQDAPSDANVARVRHLFGVLGVRTRMHVLAADAHRQALDLAAGINFSNAGRQDMITLANFLLGREH
ncbi:MAG: polyprenyl synthetase family protein [Chloroflexota bacterium]